MFGPHRSPTRTDTLFPYTALFRSIAVQGVWMMADPTKAQASAIAPHTVLADTQPRSMTIDEIQELIEAHAVAAAHAEQAGADGFEFPINAGGGLQSFTSDRKSTRLNSSH